MRTIVRIVVVALLAAWLAPPGMEAAKKKARSKTAAAKATRTVKKKAGSGRSARKTTARKGKASARKATARKGSRARSARHRKARVARPASQSQPTPERYAEIQQAMAARGYSGGDANGEWNSSWRSELQRFQKDQSLDPDGKLGALTLKALGLGAKRMPAQTTAAPGVVPVPETRTEQ